MDSVNLKKLHVKFGENVVGEMGTKYKEGSGSRFEQNTLYGKMKSLKNKFL